MNKQKNRAVVLVAAGKGQRMGGEIPKQSLVLDGKEILAHTVEVWENHKDTVEIILVVRLEDIEFAKGLIQKYGWQKIAAVVPGGDMRGDSVCNGLAVLSEDVDLVSVHDGVRPFVTEKMIDAAVAKAEEMGAAVVGVPVKDTIKRCGVDGLVLGTPNREELWMVQTPQTFRVDLLKKAYEAAHKTGFVGTDDASVVEFAGHPVEMVMGDYRNIKITTKEDLLLVNFFLRGEKS